MSDQTSSTPEAAESSPGRYTVIARRYRPQAFEDLVGQEHVARALQQAITSDRVGHAYLFTGARGVGKTSAARILAKALNCVHGPTPTPCNECDVCQRVTSGDDIDVLEIDGASNRGIDEIRQLRQNVAVRPSRVRYKVYIIDEVHMLTKEAFNALLKTLEEPPEHVKFIFATTEPQKIPITILSRCQRFDFAGISAASIQHRLAQIAAAEGVEVETEALQILASRAAGSMRDSQSLLEQLLAIGGERITAADVNALLGIAPAERLNVLVRHLAEHNAPAALTEMDATIQSGVEVGLLLDQLVGYFRDVMALAVGCNADQMLYALPSQYNEIADLGQRLGLSTILAIGQILDQTSARMRVSMHGRTLVEMAIVRICQLGELDDLAELITELRGTRVGQPVDAGSADAKSARGDQVTSATRLTGGTSAPSKKNADATATPTLANGLASAVASALATPPAAISPAPLQAAITSARTGASEVAATNTRSHNDVNNLLTESADATPITPQNAPSMQEQYQRALSQGGLASAAPLPPRTSRREQLAQVSEQPFIRRAMELFDVAPDKLRYSPPQGVS